MEDDRHPKIFLHTSSFENFNLFKPFNKSYVWSTASAPNKSLWIDARCIIHIMPSFNESRKPSVKYIHILETPPSLPPKSEPPLYIDGDINSFRQTTMFLPVPDRHQPLLNYFATDFPGLSDEHPVLLDEIAKESFKYCECQDNMCARD
jgi:hypothetical protein